MKDKFIIRRENPQDYAETENVVRASFWNIYRPGCLEHFVLHELRKDKDFIPQLDFVMENQGRIVGQVMCLKAVIHADDGKQIPIMTLGPICILPEYQRKGYGKILLDYVLEQAENLGFGAVCFEGNIDFYSHSGFVLASAKKIHYYAEPRESEVPYFLLKELKQNYLDGVEGVYQTPQGYFVDQNAAEEFDKKFPPKQKSEPLIKI